MIDAGTVSIIKSTAPILAPRAEELTRLFYERMFHKNPEVRPFFNPAHQISGVQQRALSNAIVAYATHIDRLDALGPHVELIAQKHASLGVLPEHYPIVGENLLAAIEELLQDAATDEVLAAWGQAYQFLAGILIQREEEIYRAHEREFESRGFRPFRVARKVRESDEITSFYMSPANGATIGRHLPGQYITVRMQGTKGLTTMRNYSLSNAPGTPHYRISVKREKSASHSTPDGHVSNTLHDDVHESDELEVAPPCGNFFLDTTTEASRPLVLLSGGVGITPILSMLHAAVAADLPRDIRFIHAARNPQVHAFAKEVRDLSHGHARTQAHFCYDEPAGTAELDPDACTIGRIDLPLLQRLLDGPEADFYFCGPKPFMSAVESALQAWNVPSEQIRYEFFGPAQNLQSSIETRIS
jgi:nitric oxide dioxygenase